MIPALPQGRAAMTATMLQGTYSPPLVLVSLVVAILAAYTALDLAERVRVAQGRAAHSWLAGGAFAMGLGIWSMHFIGMLAFDLPIAVGYDLPMTAASLAIAVAASALALFLVTRPALPWSRLAVGAGLMGGGVAAMHYLGMAAMRMAPGIDYQPGWFALSLLIAVGASGLALWLTFRLRRDTPYGGVARVLAAVVMGFGIVGMHYVGMEAARFPLGSVCMAISSGSGIDTGWLAILVAVITLAVLGIALLVAILDARMAARTSMLSSSLAIANEQLVELALHDTLTKLPNRILLQDRLGQALEKAARKNLRFAVMFMDLDGFKAVNDAYGHHVGDQLLVQIADRIRGSLRSRDTIARIGGDEFVIVVELDDMTDAAHVADTLIGTVDRPVQVAGHELQITTSVGVAMYPEDGRTPHALLTNADAAMYHAKSGGSNAYSFFEASMNANAQEQLQLLHDLRAAITNREFVLHYQPKFRAPSGPVIGAEALLRWQHPTLGMRSPDVIIPLAEKAGLMVPIGEWVLDEACRQLRVWLDAGHPEWTMAVNLSPVQFAHIGLVEMVASTLARHGVPASNLVLEVTEATAMRDVEVSLAVLNRLAALGVSISIDDFGTGYSSLMYLKRLPATELKIDRGFVQQLAHDNEDAAIVSAIVALGQKLHLNIVAEGVETTEQQSFLTDLGCDSLQGFLLGKPTAGDEFMATVDAAT
jgi:diguanylate cyclase (GGDEF)-like protein